ncbi:hypothetical protein RI129_009724 [Pyrocoelia pectoralis]|uniref:Uncharacterized protein n=1 Tax=Pyrocoelia pectoralis TaxID=417401 RepID=A0AAN7ZF60_9COLE
MSDLTQFSKSFMEDFIELYINYLCLWKTKSSDCKDRNKKDTAYTALLKKLQEIGGRCSSLLLFFFIKTKYAAANRKSSSSLLIRAFSKYLYGKHSITDTPLPPTYVQLPLSPSSILPFRMSHPLSSHISTNNFPSSRKYRFLVTSFYHLQKKLSNSYKNGYETEGKRYILYPRKLLRRGRFAFTRFCDGLVQLAAGQVAERTTGHETRGRGQLAANCF